MGTDHRRLHLRRRERATSLRASLRARDFAPSATRTVCASTTTCSGRNSSTWKRFRRWRDRLRQQHELRQQGRAPRVRHISAVPRQRDLQRNPPARRILRGHQGAQLSSSRSESRERFPFCPIPNLQPEQNHSWEAGFEQGFWGNRLSLSAVYYDNQFHNQIEFQTNPVDFTSQYVNLNKSMAHGAEVELRGQIGNHFSFTGAYTYTSTRIQEAPPCDPAVL